MTYMLILAKPSGFQFREIRALFTFQGLPFGSVLPNFHTAPNHFGNGSVIKHSHNRSPSNSAGCNRTNHCRKHLLWLHRTFISDCFKNQRLIYPEPQHYVHCVTTLTTHWEGKRASTQSTHLGCEDCLRAFCNNLKLYTHKSQAIGKLRAALKTLSAMPEGSLL